eukprot:GHUV01048198.1.p1 GENE.GHUV01048198.1~~GHUV01048198.1.p1  ORF type:complete len:124 (+),score=23.08 GHUV01048198.1:247-618(+)
MPQVTALGSSWSLAFQAVAHTSACSGPSMLLTPGAVLNITLVSEPRPAQSKLSQPGMPVSMGSLTYMYRRARTRSAGVRPCTQHLFQHLVQPMHNMHVWSDIIHVSRAALDAADADACESIVC